MSDMVGCARRRAPLLANVTSRSFLLFVLVNFLLGSFREVESTELQSAATDAPNAVDSINWSAYRLSSWDPAQPPKVTPLYDSQPFGTAKNMEDAMMKFMSILPGGNSLLGPEESILFIKDSVVNAFDSEKVKLGISEHLLKSLLPSPRSSSSSSYCCSYTAAFPVTTNWPSFASTLPRLLAEKILSKTPAELADIETELNGAKVKPPGVKYPVELDNFGPEMASLLEAIRIEPFEDKFVAHYFCKKEAIPSLEKHHTIDIMFQALIDPSNYSTWCTTLAVALNNISKIAEPIKAAVGLETDGDNKVDTSKSNKKKKKKPTGKNKTYEKKEEEDRKQIAEVSVPEEGSSLNETEGSEQNALVLETITYVLVPEDDSSLNETGGSEQNALLRETTTNVSVPEEGSSLNKAKIPEQKDFASEKVTNVSVPEVDSSLNIDSSKQMDSISKTVAEVPVPEEGSSLNKAKDSELKDLASVNVAEVSVPEDASRLKEENILKQDFASVNVAKVSVQEHASSLKKAESPSPHADASKSSSEKSSWTTVPEKKFIKASKLNSSSNSQTNASNTTVKAPNSGSVTTNLTTTTRPNSNTAAVNVSIKEVKKISSERSESNLNPKSVGLTSNTSRKGVEPNIQKPASVTKNDTNGNIDVRKESNQILLKSNQPVITTSENVNTTKAQVLIKEEKSSERSESNLNPKSVGLTSNTTPQPTSRKGVEPNIQNLASVNTNEAKGDIPVRKEPDQILLNSIQPVSDKDNTTEVQVLIKEEKSSEGSQSNPNPKRRGQTPTGIHWRTSENVDLINSKLESDPNRLAPRPTPTSSAKENVPNLNQTIFESRQRVNTAIEVFNIHVGESLAALETDMKALIDNHCTSVKQKESKFLLSITQAAKYLKQFISSEIHSLKHRSEEASKNLEYSKKTVETKVQSLGVLTDRRVEALRYYITEQISVFRNHFPLETDHIDLALAIDTNLSSPEYIECRRRYTETMQLNQSPGAPPGFFNLPEASNLYDALENTKHNSPVTSESSVDLDTRLPGSWYDPRASDLWAVSPNELNGKLTGLSPKLDYEKVEADLEMLIPEDFTAYNSLEDQNLSLESSRLRKYLPKQVDQLCNNATSAVTQPVEQNGEITSELNPNATPAEIQPVEQNDKIISDLNANATPFNLCSRTMNPSPVMKYVPVELADYVKRHPGPYYYGDQNRNNLASRGW